MVDHICCRKYCIIDQCLSSNCYSLRAWSWEDGRMILPTSHSLGWKVKLGGREDIGKRKKERGKFVTICCQTQMWSWEDRLAPVLLSSQLHAHLLIGKTQLPFKIPNQHESILKIRTHFFLWFPFKTSPISQSYFTARLSGIKWRNLCFRSVIPGKDSQGSVSWCHRVRSAPIMAVLIDWCTVHGSAQQVFWLDKVVTYIATALDTSSRAHTFPVECMLVRYLLSPGAIGLGVY